MRWIRFTQAGRTAYGVLDGERIEETVNDPFAMAEPERTGRTHALADVRIEAPFIPRTFYAAGLNYVAHAREMAEKHGLEPALPGKPDMGYRAVNASPCIPATCCGWAQTAHLRTCRRGTWWRWRSPGWARCAIRLWLRSSAGPFAGRHS